MEKANIILSQCIKSSKSSYNTSTYKVITSKIMYENIEYWWKTPIWFQHKQIYKPSIQPLIIQHTNISESIKCIFDVALFTI